MLRYVTLSFIAAMTLSITASAQTPAGQQADKAKPNYSGTWKLNPSKSDFGPVPVPEKEIDTIEHQEPSFKASIDSVGGPAGDQKYTYTVTTDRKESTADLGGSPAKRKAHWESDGLVIVTQATLQGNDLQITNKYKLGDDGKTLTVESHIAGGFGEFDIKRVYEKQ